MLSSSSPGVAPSVVYVDDAADRRTLFEQTFSVHIPRLATADAVSVVALLATSDVAVALVDIEASECCEELLRTLGECAPRTVRILVGPYADAERSLRMLDEGLASRHVARPWQRDAIVRAVSWACDGREVWRDRASLHQRLLEAERITKTAGELVHDLKSPLMAVLANADHLRTLAEEATTLRDLLLALPLSREQRRTVEGLLDDLLPMSDDLVGATEDLEALIECLRPLATSSHIGMTLSPKLTLGPAPATPALVGRTTAAPAVSLSSAAKRGT